MEDGKETLNIGKNCWEELANALEEGSKDDPKGDYKVFRPWKRDNADSRLYLDCDQLIVDNNIKIEDIQSDNCTAPGKRSKFYFCLEPTPWVGGWKNGIPKIAILSLNPGLKETKDEPKEWVNFDESFKNEGKRKAYQKLWAKNLKGEATFADVLFSTVPKKGKPEEFEHLWGKEGREYWIKHLLPLFMKLNSERKLDDDKLKKEFVEILLTLDENTVRKEYKDVISFFDKIITIELFPYHSFYGGRIKINDTLNKREKFTKNLVKFLINNHTKIIITRSKKQWKTLVDEFDDESTFISLSSTGNTCITENNCCIIENGEKKKGCFDDLANALKDNPKE